jgi:hypothetical protein
VEDPARAEGLEALALLARLEGLVAPEQLVSLEWLDALERLVELEVPEAQVNTRDFPIHIALNILWS